VQDEIARIRTVKFSTAVEATPSFNLTRRGYDRDEVDRFLSELAERLEQAERERGGAPAAGSSEAVRRELERITAKAAELLAEAEQGADRVRGEATQEASRLLARAREDAEAAKLTAEQAREEALAETEHRRQEADAYAERVRGEADADAKALRSQAASELADAVDRAEAVARAEADDEQRRLLAAELAELASRRDAAREELRKIAGILADAAGQEPAAGPGAGEAADGDAQAPLRAV
jgi:DivIVA domain-containing protein